MFSRLGRRASPRFTCEMSVVARYSSSQLAYQDSTRAFFVARLDGRAGEERWRRALPYWAWPDIEVTSRGDLVVAAASAWTDHGGHVELLSGETGVRLWGQEISTFAGNLLGSLADVAVSGNRIAVVGGEVAEGVLGPFATRQAGPKTSDVTSRQPPRVRRRLASTSASRRPK